MTVRLTSDVELARFDTLVRVDRGELAITDAVALLRLSERHHFLKQAICTFKQGRIADRTHEAQQFRASCLNLVIAAIV